MNNNLRFACIVRYPHRGGDIRPRVHTALFASRILAETHASQARAERGATATVIDREEPKNVFASVRLSA